MITAVPVLHRPGEPLRIETIDVARPARVDEGVQRGDATRLGFDDLDGEGAVVAAVGALPVEAERTPAEPLPVSAGPDVERLPDDFLETRGRLG